MKHVRLPVLGLALALCGGSAFAQMLPGTGTNGGGPAPQPRQSQADAAPPALPGAGTPAPAVPQPHKTISGDPTQALFAAVNTGDYGSAQDALSRGADLTAQNQFGETALDLAIALNRNNIVFLILETRNELSAQGAGAGPVGGPWALSASAGGPVRHTTKAPALHTKHSPPPKVRPEAAGGAAAPNAQAGFLGFDPHS